MRVNTLVLLGAAALVAAAPEHRDIFKRRDDLERGDVYERTITIFAERTVYVERRDCAASTLSTTTSSTSTSKSSTSTSTSSTTTSSSTTSSAPSSQASVSCPGSNGVTYTAATGAKFLLECYIDHAGGDLSVVYVSTYAQAVEACAATKNCVAFSWLPGTNNPSYMKSSVPNGVTNNGVWGGKLISSASSSSTSSTTSTSSTSSLSTAVTTTSKTSTTSTSSTTSKSSTSTTSTASSLTPSSTSGYWYANINHNGISPFIANGASWKVFRNVKTDFGAKGDGVTDDSAAFQAALNFGNSAGDRSALRFGTTGQPAVVFIPAGTYILNGPIQSYIGTVIMGDPINPPVLKASSSYPSNQGFLWYAKDPNQDATNNFYISMKNLVLDSTLVSPSQTINLLDWSISQAVQLTNVVFNMPVGAAGHTGIQMYEGGSPLSMNDVTFNGGNLGMGMIEQQYHLRGITFNNVITGILMYHLFEGTFQGLTFNGCQIGIDNRGNNTGFLALIDSTATKTGVVLSTANSPSPEGSFVLENVIVDGSVPATVQADGVTVLSGSVVSGGSWIWGDVYSPSSTTAGLKVKGRHFTASRPAGLTDGNGNYYAVKAPTYKEYDVTQVINVKSVAGSAVAGDGVTDDTANLQTIINNAGGKVLFFPHGTYIVSKTLTIPAGTRIHGEAWSEISGNGAYFQTETAPKPIVQVGQPGSTGVAQFVDMLFTVADILPGAVLVEVNMAGNNPGDVGFFNTHFRIGGARGSKVQTNCGDPNTCKAARLCAHLTTTSSSYWENSWCWSADHDLDDTYSQNPSTAGGFLIESTKPTWLSGIGSEHNALYQMNLYQASNIFIGFQQSETPYWQGNGSNALAPAPWSNSLLPSDPTFSWCAATDAQCRMAVYQLITKSSNVNAYGGGFWTFFNGQARNLCSSDCQQNAVLYGDNTNFYVYGVNTHMVRTLVLDGDGGSYKALANEVDNAGGWGGVVAAYLPSLS